MANPRHNKQTTNRRGAMGGGMMKRVGYKDGTGAGTGLKILKKESIYSKKLKDSKMRKKAKELDYESEAYDVKKPKRKGPLQEFIKKNWKKPFGGV